MIIETRRGWLRDWENARDEPSYPADTIGSDKSSSVTEESPDHEIHTPAA